MATWQEVLIAVPAFIIMAAVVIVGHGFKRRMKEALRR